MSDSRYIMQCQGLFKNYGSFCALNNVNLSIPSGRVVGLLGPNGSGKTTLIKIAAGLLTATNGSVAINGMHVGVETKALTSYLPEKTYFAKSMKVGEALDYFADFYADFDYERARMLMSRMGISLDSRMGTLSKGTCEKVQLVLVMSRRARLYLLDEPIGGVDPAARELILDTIITNLNREATTILSTHLIYDIERILDDAIFLCYGQVLLYDSAENIRSQRGMSINDVFKEDFRC